MRKQRWRRKRLEKKCWCYGQNEEIKGNRNKKNSKYKKSRYSSAAIRRSTRIQLIGKFIDTNPIEILDADTISGEDINECSDTGDMPNASRSETHSVSLDKIDHLQSTREEDYCMNVDSRRSKEILTYSE